METLLYLFKKSIVLTSSLETLTLGHFEQHLLAAHYPPSTTSLAAAGPLICRDTIDSKGALLCCSRKWILTSLVFPRKLRRIDCPSTCLDIGFVLLMVSNKRGGVIDLKRRRRSCCSRTSWILKGLPKLFFFQSRSRRGKKSLSL